MEGCRGAREEATGGKRWQDWLGLGASVHSTAASIPSRGVGERESVTSSSAFGSLSSQDALRLNAQPESYRILFSK